MPTVSVFRGLMCLGIDNAWRNLCLEIIYRDCLGPGASLFFRYQLCSRTDGFGEPAETKDWFCLGLDWA